jgi:hypothetical protein
MKNNNKLPFLRTENLVVKELPSELLIYDLEENKAFCLNETARLVMDECDGTQTIDEAIKSLNHKLNAKMSEEMVWMVIEQFKKSNLLKDDYQVPIETTKVTRRKILHSAAALGITLPIITSLVAPVAAQVQSGCVPSEQPCVNTEGGSNCCEDLFCVNVESGPTGFICLGCTPLGELCTIGQTICCQGFCSPDGNVEADTCNFNDF